jgi:hypothetical protein
MDSTSAYILASCDAAMPSADAIATACSSTCDVTLTSIGDGLFALSPDDEPKLDASIKVEGVIVRLRT